MADQTKSTKNRKTKAKPRPTWFGRFYVLILLAFFCIGPFCLYSALQAVDSNKNQVDDWLPTSFKETNELAWYKEHFVGDQFVVVSWVGCAIDGKATSPDAMSPDPRIDQLASLLVSGSPVGGRAEAGPYSTYFKSIATGPRTLEHLVGPPSNLPFALAKKRLTGSLIGADGSQTCLIVTLSDESLLDIGKALSRPAPAILGFRYPPGAIYEALQECGISPDEVRIGGPPVDNVAIDEEGERSFVRLVGISGLLGLALSWLSLRSIRHTLIVFASGVLSATGSLSTLWLAGTNTDAIVLSMPPLVYVLAVSGAIHLINYYREVVDQVGVTQAPGRAMQLGWKPAMYCSVTTALGLISLCTSEITPIRKFGFYSAIGVMEMLVVLFLFLPAALYAWPQSRTVGHKPTGNKNRVKDCVNHSTETRSQVFWRRLGSLMVRRHAIVTLTFAVVLVSLAAGLKQLH